MHSSRKTLPSRRIRTAAGPVNQATITSRVNHWIKQFRAALQGSRRDDGGWIGIEGPHLVEAALRSGMNLGAILVSPAGEEQLKRIEDLLASVKARRELPDILRTTDRLFGSVAGTDTPQGLAALAKPRAWSFEDLFRGDVPLVTVLCGVQDPGNVGTILRSAEAFGATGVIAARGTAHPFAPKVLRASAGSALRMPILAGIAVPVALAQLRVSGLRLFAASSKHTAADRAVVPSAADLRGPAAILIGNEGAGLPPEIIRSADESILIPLVSEVESLNAAVAASVLLYEAARQRDAESRA